MTQCTDIKHAVRVLTAQEGVTQSALAERMGTTQSIVSRTINKPDHRMSTDLLPIAAALGCCLELRFIRHDGSVAAVVPYVPAEAQSGEE